MLYLSVFGVKFVHSLRFVEMEVEEYIRSHIFVVPFVPFLLAEVPAIRRLQTLFAAPENPKRIVLAFPANRYQESNH